MQEWIDARRERRRLQEIADEQAFADAVNRRQDEIYALLERAEEATKERYRKMMTEKPGGQACTLK